MRNIYKEIIYIFIALLSVLYTPSLSHSQGPSSCACVWSDNEGNLHCSFGNCGGQNWSNCYNQVSTPNLWQTLTCPNPPTTNCDPYMWNTGTNGSCWYQGAGCSGQAVCEYITISLPVELIDFSVEKDGNNNILTWKTASEINSDYYILENSTDGYNFKMVALLPGAGNTNTITDYKATHIYPEKSINYYRLIQVDINGVYDVFDIISVDNSDKEVEKIIDMMGREVEMDFEGIKIIIFKDGTTNKVY